jgi:hypothetical protein
MKHWVICEASFFGIIKLTGRSFNAIWHVSHQQIEPFLKSVLMEVHVIAAGL